MKLRQILLIVTVLILLFSLLSLVNKREIREGIDRELLNEMLKKYDKDVKIFSYYERNLIPLSLKELGGLNVSLEIMAIMPVKVNFTYIPRKPGPGYPLLLTTSIKPENMHLAIKLLVRAQLGENILRLARETAYDRFLTPVSPIEIDIPLSFNLSLGAWNTSISIDTFASISLTLKAPLKASLVIRNPITSRPLYKKEVSWDTLDEKNFTFVIPRNYYGKMLVAELGNWSMDFCVELSKISIGVKVLDMTPIDLQLKLSAPIIKYSIGRSVPPEKVNIEIVRG